MRHTLSLSIALVMIAGPALAEDSGGHASAALTASGNVVGNLTASGVQAVGGVVALPLGIAGGLSEVVGGVAQAGGDSLQATGIEAQGAAERAITDAWGPLTVDDRVVVRPDLAPKVPYAAKPVAR